MAIQVAYVDALTFQHAARRRQLAFQCATEMLEYGKTHNRPDLVKEATDILETLKGGMS